MYYKMVFKKGNKNSEETKRKMSLFRKGKSWEHEIKKIRINDLKEILK